MKVFIFWHLKRKLQVTQLCKSQDKKRSTQSY